MAKDEIERDIGEMRACVSNIKLMLQTSHENEINIFERLGKIEQNLATVQSQIIGIDKRIDDICAERDKEKDRELSRNNNKLVLWGIIVSVVSIAVSAILVIIFKV